MGLISEGAIQIRAVWISKNEVREEIMLKPKDDDQRKRKITKLLSLIKENT